MAETCVQLTLAAAVRLMQRFNELRCVDATTSKLKELIQNVFFALREADGRDLAGVGVKSPSMEENIKSVQNILLRLEAWILNYEAHSAKKGVLVRIAGMYDQLSSSTVNMFLCPLDRRDTTASESRFLRITDFPIRDFRRLF
jgi:hypothetical protein